VAHRKTWPCRMVYGKFADCSHICARGGVWEKALTEDKVQVLVNKQFSTPETTISDTDVIAIVSSSPG